VIHVRVGDPDRIERRARILYFLDKPITFAAGIDDHRVVGLIVHHQVAVLLERSDGDGFDVHHYDLALRGDAKAAASEIARIRCTRQR
jgi:hypothetical protein